jgi:hypothetical protein
MVKGLFLYWVPGKGGDKTIEGNFERTFFIKADFAEAAGTWL